MTEDENPQPEPSGPRPSRRQLLGLGAAGGAALLAGGAWPQQAGAQAAASADRWPFRTRGSTLDRTLLRGDPSTTAGYRPLVLGPGEPHLIRRELVGGTTGSAADRRGRPARRPIVALGQLTDIHV
ncbi:MAG TPA: twin-arginine translocation signal domain-containing protein, partial [Jatrophihabitans sp.]|nr:twin-arginine translocation signal domain-containing protein [Jatrophihabitans sp.]